MPAHIGTWMCCSLHLGIGETELDRPTTGGFVRHIDATLGQQTFDIPKAQRKPAAAIGDGAHRRSIARQALSHHMKAI
jgi:hypothetical protein